MKKVKGGGFERVKEELPSVVVFVLGGVCMLIVLILSFMGKR